MPTEDSSVHNIILSASHELELRGHKTTVPCGAMSLTVPHICGCASIFVPGGWAQTDEDGTVREVWVQDGFKFNKKAYRGPLSSAF